MKRPSFICHRNMEGICLVKKFATFMSRFHENNRRKTSKKKPRFAWKTAVKLVHACVP